VSGGTNDVVVTADGVYTAPLELTYPYKRTVGPVMSRSFTSLRDGRIEGGQVADGTVIVPPPDFDPRTGSPVTEFVEVGPAGIVVSWSWVPEPMLGHPLDRPFAFALITLDGANSPMLHAVDCGSPDRLKSGSRVTVRWAAERVGSISDIECFEVIK
jgi:uncharacterized protein